MWHGIMDRGPGLFHDFELDRSPCLFLDHGATVSHPAAGAYVVDLRADEIATSELAVDREVEQGKISLPTLQLNPNPNGPLPARTGERRRSHNHTSPPRVP